MFPFLRVALQRVVCLEIMCELSVTRKLARVGVSSGVSWFWNSVRACAVWCALLARNLLTLLECAVSCSSVRLRSSD